MENKYLNKIENLYSQNKDADNALYMKGYLLNQFEFFGLKAQKRRELDKLFLKESGLPDRKDLQQVLRYLWGKPEREFHHFAMELLAKFVKLKYKTKTNTKLLFRYVVELSSSKEFFIKKAIGWALREYSKTNPPEVLEFVENHPLSPFSKKEALKRIEKI